MKKNIVKIGLLSLILIIISTTIILLFGKTYIVSFDNLNNNYSYKLTVDNEVGKIKILEEKKKLTNIK